MQDETRKSGIDVIGNVSWGTHFCQFYQTKQDLLDTLVPYFKTGLENNEFCMWVTADNLTVAEARKAMTKAMKGFSTYLKKGQIEILPYTEWYLRDGVFNSQNVLNGWIEKLNHALKKGYDGLRLTGNTFWLEKETWRSFAEYEASVNNVIGHYKIIALCTYSLEKCGAAEIVDVIRNHEFALIKQNGKWELFESSRYENIKVELKENEKRFRLALKNAPVTVAAQDNDLRFLWAYNQRTVNPEAVLGKNDFEVFPKSDAEKLTSLKRHVLQTGESLNEKMWVTSNGKKVFLDLFLEPTKDQNGKITGVEIATVDLTRMKQMEGLLYSERDKLRLVLDSMEDGVCIINQDYSVEYINPSLQAQFGNVEGKKCYQYLNDVQSICSYCNIKEVIASGRTIRREQMSGKTGRTHEISHSPLMNADGSISILAVFHDITERKKAEQDVIRVNRELQAIRECDQTIVHSDNEMTLLADVCRILCTTAGYRLAWVGTVEPDEAKSVRPLVWHGDEEYIAKVNITWADTERGRGPAGLAVRTGKTHFFQDFSADPEAAPWREAALSLGYRSSIAIPLKEYNDSVFAVLCLYSSEPNSFNPAEVRLLEELANDISFGIIALRERAKRQQAEIEMTHLASFPELNPNPILELDINGQIKYLNPSAKVIFPDLATLGVKHPFMADWTLLVQTLNSDKLNQSATREISIGEAWYEQTIMYLSNVHSCRIYAREVTERKKTEIVLKDNEARNRLILETALDGVWTNDLSGRLLYVNDAYCQMIGYTREELLTMYIFDIEAKEKKNETKEHIDKVIRQGGDRFETSHIRKDGKIIDVEISVRYSNMGGGQLVVFARNITERKQILEELKKSQEQFSKAFHSSPVALSIFRLSDGMFIDINRSFEYLFGYRRDELINKTAIELHIFDNPNDRNEIWRLLDQEGRVVNFEVTARIKNGREIKVLTSAEKIELNGQLHIIWTTIDISERQQAENLLRETSNYLNSLLDYANAPIIVWDTHFRISRFNPAFERLTGYKAQDVLGLNLDILFPEEKKTESLELIRLTLTGERWEVVEIPILRIDGEIRTVLWNSANVYDTSGKTIIATVAQGQDITERKQTEEENKKLNEEITYRAAELEVANIELETFAYSVSHDLRAPLRSMEGFSQALLEDCQDILNDECKNYLRRIQGSAELMAQLIDDMLRLSRITRADMIMDNIDLSGMVQNIAAKLKKDEPKRNVKFTISPEITAYGDEKLLSIMMENLLENAWKFTGKIPEAQIEFGTTERDGHKTYFMRDNGVGFDMTYANKLFKPFQRLHSTSEFPGSGIGLASVQRIVQRHGGKVWAEGKVGEGATFYFTLGGE